MAPTRISQNLELEEENVESTGQHLVHGDRRSTRPDDIHPSQRMHASGLDRSLMDSITSAVSIGIKAALNEPDNRHAIASALDIALQRSPVSPDASLRDSIVADVAANLTHALQDLHVSPVTPDRHGIAGEGSPTEQDAALSTRPHRQSPANVCKLIVDDVFAAFTSYLASDQTVKRWTDCFFEEASFADFRKAIATLAKRLPSNVSNKPAHLQLLQQVQVGVIRLGPVSKDIQHAIQEQLAGIRQSPGEADEPSLLNDFTYLMEIYDSLVADAWKLTSSKRKDLDRQPGQDGRVAQVLRQLESRKLLLAETAQTAQSVAGIKDASVHEQLRVILNEAAALQELDLVLADVPNLHALSTLLMRFNRMAITSTDIDKIIAELTGDSEQYSSIIGLQNAIAALDLLRNVPSGIHNPRGFRKLIDSIGHLSDSISLVKRSLDHVVSGQQQSLKDIIDTLTGDLKPRASQLTAIQERVAKNVAENLDKITVAPKHSSIVHRLPDGMVLETVANFFSIESTAPLEIWGPEESVKAFVHALHKGYRRHDTASQLGTYKRSLLALSTALDPYMRHYGLPALGSWLLTSVLDDRFQSQYQQALQECASQYKSQDRRSFVNTAVDDTRLTLQRIRVLLVMVRQKIIDDCKKPEAEVRHIQLNIIVPATFHGGFYPITKPSQPSTFDIWLFNDDGQQEATSSSAEFSLHSSWSAFAPADAARAEVSFNWSRDRSGSHIRQDPIAPPPTIPSVLPSPTRSQSRPTTRGSSRPASRMFDKFRSSEETVETESCEAASIHLWDPNVGEDLSSAGPFSPQALHEKGWEHRPVLENHDPTTKRFVKRPISESSPTAAESILQLLHLGGDGAPTDRSQKRKSLTESVKRSSVGSLQSLRNTLTSSRRRGSHGSANTIVSALRKQDIDQPTKEPPMPPAGEIMSPVNADLRERYGLGTYHRAGWLDGPDTSRALEAAGLSGHPEYLATLQHAESRQRLIRRNEKSLQYCIGSATEKRLHNKGRIDKAWDDVNGPCNECQSLERDCWVYIPSNFIIVKHARGESGHRENEDVHPAAFSNGLSRQQASTGKPTLAVDTPPRPPAMNAFVVPRSDKGKQRQAEDGSGV